MKTFFCQNAGGSNSRNYKITNGRNVKSDFAVSSNMVNAKYWKMTIWLLIAMLVEIIRNFWRRFGTKADRKVVVRNQMAALGLSLFSWKKVCTYLCYSFWTYFWFDFLDSNYYLDSIYLEFVLLGLKILEKWT